MIVVIAVLSVMALSALLIALFALFQARAMLQATAKQIEAFRSQQDSAADELRASLEKLTSEVRELQEQPSAGPTGLIKKGLNLNKRSQVLRMHRRGDSPAQIATVLDIPPQEVELLIKVQRIVLSNL